MHSSDKLIGQKFDENPRRKHASWHPGGAPYRAQCFCTTADPQAATNRSGIQATCCKHVTIILPQQTVGSKHQQTNAAPNSSSQAAPSCRNELPAAAGQSKPPRAMTINGQPDASQPAAAGGRSKRCQSTTANGYQLPRVEWGISTTASFNAKQEYAHWHHLREHPNAHETAWLLCD